ncbi:DUF4381 domain-containing protein [Dasania marina]|uniref:DUF4381 domain-containing protein n=1 Tax=Dasania marina TaxID=471499 RepID=UPI0030DD0375|tara:strand:- start:5007 stop:5504 length:498 start_codon:yes stop_codon:yes gene_type:complete
MNMPSQDPLAQLRDIHTPPAIDFWPLAPGWWLLIVLSLSVLVILFYSLRRYRRRNAFKRVATQQVQQLSQQHSDDSLYIQQLNRLLKQTALAVNPRQDIAALHGDAWLHFLDQHSSKNTQAFSDGVGQVLGHGPYQATVASVDRPALNQLVSLWIKQQSAKRLQA